MFDKINICLFILAASCLCALVFLEYLVPRYGECTINSEQEICQLGFLTVISKGEIQ